MKADRTGYHARPLLHLWRQVLANGLTDPDAHRWVNTRGFFDVCHLADLDPIAVRDAWAAKHARDFRKAMEHRNTQQELTV